MHHRHRGHRARLIATEPTRIADTRPFFPPVSNGDTPIGQRENLELPIRGAGPVPSNPNVTAVVVNLTGINDVPGPETFLSASPAPLTEPTATFSNGNYRPGIVRANLAIVPLSDDGSLFLYNNRGQLNVAVDVVGYLVEGRPDSSTEGRILPLEAPFRSFDTRDAEFNSVKLGAGFWEDWSFDAFAGSVEIDGEPVGAQSSLFGNLTAAEFVRQSPTEATSNFLTLNPAYPDGGYPVAPSNSHLNFTENLDVANAAIVRYGSKGGDDYMVSAFNQWGATHYLLDVSAVNLD